MNQYLLMLSLDPFEAAACINQEIRVENEAGEKKDNLELKLVDEQSMNSVPMDETKRDEAIHEFIYKVQTKKDKDNETSTIVETIRQKLSSSNLM